MMAGRWLRQQPPDRPTFEPQWKRSGPKAFALDEKGREHNP
jgi:hypothetical protein